MDIENTTVGEVSNTSIKQIHKIIWPVIYVFILVRGEPDLLGVIVQWISRQ